MIESIDPLYLDHAASTPPDPEVVEAMLPWLQELHANPHSDHFHGQRAAQAVASAREAVAELIGTCPDNLIFTSGATESNNLALQGFLGPGNGRRVLATSKIEHKSVLSVAQALSEQGVEQIVIPVDPRGTILPDAFERALTSEGGFSRSLAAIAHGNSEIGTIQQLQPLSEISHRRGFRLHVDASQTAGKVRLDVEADGIDFATVASHKLYGPAGIGALFIAEEAFGDLRPLLHGGAQERSLRAGTVPVFLAVGFGMAARLALSKMRSYAKHGDHLTSTFLGRLHANGVSCLLIGEPKARLPGHVSVAFSDVSADDLLALVATKLSASTGSACSAGDLRASYVLRGIGLSENAASKVIRITFGRRSSLDDAIRAADVITKATERIHSRD